MRAIRATTGALLLLAASGAASVAGEVGLALGEAAPKFTLMDQNGDSRSLDSLLVRGRLAIVFFRSADW